MKYTSYGYLKIRVYTAKEALPVPNVNVRIYGNEESTNGTDFSVITSESGLTEILELPAPDVSYSLSPNSSEQAYSTYNIEVSHENFYSKRIDNVPIFAGILSVLPVELIPNAGLERNVSSPNSNNFAVIYENEELE